MIMIEKSWETLLSVLVKLQKFPLRYVCLSTTMVIGQKPSFVTF